MTAPQLDAKEARPGMIVRVPGDTAPVMVASPCFTEDREEGLRVVGPLGDRVVPLAGVTLVAQHMQELMAVHAQQRADVLNRYKEEVRDKAMSAAEEHGWCDEVKTLLGELGIKQKVQKVRAVMQLTVEVDAVITQGTALERLDLTSGDNREWWNTTIRFQDDADGTGLDLRHDDDLDMDESEVRVISSAVTEIHDESYEED